MQVGVKLYLLSTEEANSLPKNVLMMSFTGADRIALTYKAAIEAARKAYDALSADQKISMASATAAKPPPSFVWLSRYVPEGESTS